MIGFVPPGSSVIRFSVLRAFLFLFQEGVMARGFFVCLFGTKMSLCRGVEKGEKEGTFSRASDARMT